jgi:CheY-like chemotaxis protein/HAMP domain-containing protein
MSRATAFLRNLALSGWNYTDLKTRIITPVILVIGLMTAFTGYNFYQSESSRLHEELNLRGQVITASLSAYATNAMTPERKPDLENHIKAFIEDKKLLHAVKISQNRSTYLAVTSGTVREKLLPETLKHYTLPIYASDGKREIGTIEASLSTQQIEDYLETRAVQITLVCAAVVVACTILLSWLLSYVVIRPLERLTNKVQAISEGRLNEKVISMSWDEIGHLFHDINHMRVRFRKKESDFIESLLKRKHYKSPDFSTISCKALVVDDDDTVRAIAAKLLEKNHISVVTAIHGKDALDKLEHNHFDMILLDLMMPEMNGFEVLKHIKDNPAYNTLPVIVVSSISDKEAIVEALNTGATDFIIKPFNHDELIARIHVHLGKYLSERELDSLIEQEIGSLKT